MCNSPKGTGVCPESAVGAVVDVCELLCLLAALESEDDETASEAAAILFCMSESAQEVERELAESEKFERMVQAAPWN